MLKFALQQPMAILAAIGIVSLFKQVITLHEDVLYLVNVYENVTHPIWEHLFGSLFAIFKLEVPWWLKDYMTMGLIVSGAFVRNYVSRLNGIIAITSAFITSFLFWPVIILANAIVLGMHSVRSNKLKRLRHE